MSKRKKLCIESDEESDEESDSQKDEIKIIMNREWCMPSKDTFAMKPIRDLLTRYIQKDMIVVDPFARNSKWGTITNDINEETEAKYHLDALEFLDKMIKKDVLADVVLLDPPYSNRQISECYKAIGRKVTMQDTQNASFMKEVKDRVGKIVKNNGMVICFAWNTSGMGIKRGFKLKEILLVAHGGAHNDSLVTVELKQV